MGARVFQRPERPSRIPGPHPSLALLGFLALCLLVGLSAGAVTATSVHGWFRGLVRPPGAPPDWVFGPVWSTLYVLMAVAAWRVWRRGGPGEQTALQLWGWQLGVNALWTPAFFGLRSTLGGVVVILPLVVLVVLTTRRFWRLDRTAGLLLAPYVAWTSYAAYLSLGFFVLNGLSR